MARNSAERIGSRGRQHHSPPARDHAAMRRRISADFFENGGRGISRLKRDGDNFASRSLYLLAAHNLVGSPIGAFHQHIRQQAAR